MSTVNMEYCNTKYMSNQPIHLTRSLGYDRLISSHNFKQSPLTSLTSFKHANTISKKYLAQYRFRLNQLAHLQGNLTWSARKACRAICLCQCGVLKRHGRWTCSIRVAKLQSLVHINPARKDHQWNLTPINEAAISMSKRETKTNCSQWLQNIQYQKQKQINPSIS